MDEAKTNPTKDYLAENSDKAQEIGESLVQLDKENEAANEGANSIKPLIPMKFGGIIWSPSNFNGWVIALVIIVFALIVGLIIFVNLFLYK